MQINGVTEAAPHGRNEDRWATGPGWAFVLDGATAQPIPSGCIHDVPWLVDQLSAALRKILSQPGEESLADLVAQAIQMVCAAHEDTCDLSHPDSPSSTIAITRFRENSLDYLVLGDCTVLFEHLDGTVEAVSDDRTAHLPGGRPYTVDLVRTHRNQPRGFWVASTRPEAAYQALTGRKELLSLRSAALLSDGVTRLTEWYGWTNQQLVARLADRGPQYLIDQVREAENTRERPYGKAHDDATAVRLFFGQTPQRDRCDTTQPVVEG